MLSSPSAKDFFFFSFLGLLLLQLVIDTKIIFSINYQLRYLILVVKKETVMHTEAKCNALSTTFKGPCSRVPFCVDTVVIAWTLDS